MESTTDDATSLSRLGRIALGLGLALQASEDFRDIEGTIDYADSAGVPVPSLLAPLASGTMVTAGIGIALWRLPRLATGAAATFLSVVTLTMHDFWNDEEGERSGDRLAFFGNLAMLGGVLIALREAWR
ncbi:terminal quinol oxidase subunit [Halarchaeum acidiphilum MH1-52-1]|uniref:Terminal quinol oxidase subunit n=1 Tax=Halarchaeum acidiphilum MH1-52-1 TaxID=1261545 RepID=U2YUU0_9EURY|nr:DoxX family protein [Halarchaeum acidiphilum]GAD52537.1 terminal quinol oxidase subunit [Halarchaeum acidiphilum MH1-52-1]